MSSHGGKLRYKGFLRSLAPVDHLELVMNGTVVRTLKLDRDSTRRADFEGTLKVPTRLAAVRAWSDNAHPLVFDLYPYATTNAFFFAPRPQ